MTAALAPFGLALLLVLADSPRGYVSASIFAASLMLLYTTSASYHLAPWPQGLRRAVMRLDHAMIFILIAGSYTPFCLVVVGDGWGIPMLSIVWSLAGLGVLIKVLRPDAPRWLGVSLYLGLGWLSLVAVPVLLATMTPAAIAALLAGGVLYSVGAVVYALRRPDPLPRLFGYHEVFHAFVIAGSIVHFTLVAAYVM